MKADKGKPWYGADGREVSPFCVQWKPPALLLVSGLSTTSLQSAFHGSNRVELPKHGREEILPLSPKLLDSLLVAEQTEYMMNQQFPACEINVCSEIGLPCNPPSYYHLLLANTHTHSNNFCKQPEYEWQIYYLIEAAQSWESDLDSNLRFNLEPQASYFSSKCQLLYLRNGSPRDLEAWLKRSGKL